jgi:hypothetical protein
MLPMIPGWQPPPLHGDRQPLSIIRLRARTAPPKRVTARS